MTQGEDHLTRGLADLLECVRQLELGLDLGPQLLHLPPALGVLSPVIKWPMRINEAPLCGNFWLKV